MCGIVALAGVVGSRTSGSPKGTPSGDANQVRWPSGVFIADNTPERVAAFAAWRGRKVDVVLDWSERRTWEDIEAPTWLYQRWRGKPYTMVFGVAMLAEQVPGVSIEACADGAYDSHWRRFGSVVQSEGMGESIIRLGWEFNGDWYRWSARNPQAWAACWRRIVTAVRPRAPHLRWDWTVNRGDSPGLADPRQAWPGDGYVDIVGVDSYDHAPAALTNEGWARQLDGDQGLKYWLDFALAHGKPLSVPEWGNLLEGYDAGGDDPGYVESMTAFFRANAAHLAYEAVFQDDVKYYEAETRTPRSAAVYREFYAP
jgi:hypothetical protein